MPINNTIETYTLTSGGGTLNLDVSSLATMYIINGTATLTSNWTIQPQGTAVTGMLFSIKWDAEIVLDGNTITIFGTTLPRVLVDKTHNIECYYDGISWEVGFTPDLSENGSISGYMLPKNEEWRDIGSVGVMDNANPIPNFDTDWTDATSISLNYAKPSISKVYSRNNDTGLSGVVKMKGVCYRPSGSTNNRIWSMPSEYWAGLRNVYLPTVYKKLTSGTLHQCLIQIDANGRVWFVEGDNTEDIIVFLDGLEYDEVA